MLKPQNGGAYRGRGNAQRARGLTEVAGLDDAQEHKNSVQAIDSDISIINFNVETDLNTQMLNYPVDLKGQKQNAETELDAAMAS